MIGSNLLGHVPVRVCLVVAALPIITATSGTPAAATRHIPVMVQTAPAAPGIKFALNGRSFVSDEHGLALITVTRPGSYHLKIVDTTIVRDRDRLEFSLWSDGTSTTGRRIDVETFTWLQAGFDVSHRVSLLFTDAEGSRIDAHRINSVTLRAKDGSEVVLEGSGPYWLVGNQFEASSAGLEPMSTSYVVERVLVDGRDVEPAEDAWLSPTKGNWTVPLRPLAGIGPKAEAGRDVGDSGPPVWLLGLTVAGALLASTAVVLRRRGRQAADPNAVPAAIPDRVTLAPAPQREVVDLNDAMREVERFIERLESERRSLDKDHARKRA
jgi:hypothetical protein